MLAQSLGGGLPDIIAKMTAAYVKPNILEANTNYVVTDPKSEALLATGGYLKEKGYDIRVLNLVNLEESDGYNPFRFRKCWVRFIAIGNNIDSSDPSFSKFAPSKQE